MGKLSIGQFIAVLMGLLFLFAVLVAFFIFLIRWKVFRKELFLPGLRNVFLIPSVLIGAEIHHVGWMHTGTESEYAPGLLERYDAWSLEYVWYAIAWVLVVIVVFAVAEAVREKYSEKRRKTEIGKNA